MASGHKVLMSGASSVMQVVGFVGETALSQAISESHLLRDPIRRLEAPLSVRPAADAGSGVPAPARTASPASIEADHATTSRLAARSATVNGAAKPPESCAEASTGFDTSQRISAQRADEPGQTTPTTALRQNTSASRCGASERRRGCSGSPPAGPRRPSYTDRSIRHSARPMPAPEGGFDVALRRRTP